MAEHSMTGKKIWITGASRGLGAEVARQMARDGWTVAASARSEDELAELVRDAGALDGDISAFPLDITNEEACARTFRDIEAALGPLDVVLLNAGTHEPLDGRAFAVEPVRKLVEVNLMGTVHCLAPAIESFVSRKAGRIAVVASVAGYRGLPTASAYGATKAGLINMCEALRPELARAGVALSCVTPGFVKTPLTDRNPFPMPFIMEVEDAAARLVKGLAGDRFEITFPRRFTYIMKFLRMLPYAMYFAVTRRIVSKDGDGA